MRRNDRSVIHRWVAGAAVLASCGILVGCDSGSGPTSVAVREAAAATGGPSVADLMKQRGLNEADVVGALKTYVPTGKHDEYVLFASGGHGGQLLVIGVP